MLPTATNQPLRGKFCVEVEDDNAEATPMFELEEEIDLSISDMLEPVLVT